MREKIPRLVNQQDDSPERALGALQDEKKLTDAERYKARGVKSKEEMMELAKMNAAKIRARALELQEAEKKEAQEKRDEYFKSLKSGEELSRDFSGRKAEVKKKKSINLDELDAILEKDVDEAKEKESIRILEEKMGRPMTKSSLDEKERRLAEKNKNKIADEKKRKVVAKPENIEFANKAKEKIRKIVVERIKKTQQKTADKLVDEQAIDDVDSYEDHGVPLRGTRDVVPEHRETNIDKKPDVDVIEKVEKKTIGEITRETPTVPQENTITTLRVPILTEDDLPEAEEVVEESEQKTAVTQEIARTQEVDVEQENIDLIERELKKRWVDLLRKRRVVRQMLIDKEGLEFDAPIPERFTYTTEGLLPQNAREMMRLAKEKGTDAQIETLQGFLSDVAEYIDYLEEWERSVGKGDTQEIIQDIEVEEPTVQNEKSGKRKLRIAGKKLRDIKNEYSDITAEELVQKIITIQKQIVDRFPWVQFHLDKKPDHEKSSIEHYKIANWEAINQSKIYKNNGGEDVGNGKLGVKDLLSRYEKMMNKLEEIAKNKPQVTFEKRKDGSKRMVISTSQEKLKQRRGLETSIETILQNNPVGKELAELIRGGKLPFMGSYVEHKGDVGEAINESIAHLELEMNKRKKKGGLFEKVARWLKADQGYEQMKKALKQLVDWKKHL